MSYFWFLSICFIGDRLYYQEYGKGEPLIFLHGWGQSHETFLPFIKHFNDYRVVLVDLPGFGKSLEPIYYDLDYYAQELHALVIEKGYEKPIIVGHSFGGRVAIKYASKYDVSKLVLVDSAGIKHHDFRYYCKIYWYKLKKKLGLHPKGGSTDYQNASSIMKKVLISVTNESLISSMKNISCSTLLIFGERDEVTKVADAKVMEKYIRNSGLVVIPEAGHFSYLDKPKYFLLVLDSFLSSDDV